MNIFGPPDAKPFNSKFFKVIISAGGFVNFESESGISSIIRFVFALFLIIESMTKIESHLGQYEDNVGKILPIIIGIDNECEQLVLVHLVISINVVLFKVTPLNLIMRA